MGVVLAVVGAFVVTAASVATAASAQWNVSRVGAPGSAKGIVIAVVDTGVDRGHSGFGGRVLPQWDCTGGDNRCVQKNSGDQNGHGTHVAGTAAGGTIGCGTAGPSAVGVAPDVTILPIRVLDADGSGSTTGVANGIDKAVELGAHVVNLSLGGEFQSLTGASRTLSDAINRAWTGGAVPVVAAGNSGIAGISFGSGFYDDLEGIVVTATNNRDQKPGYADGVGGAKRGIAAPGGSGSTFETSVLSLLPNEECGTKNGTSMAAPHVAGGIAILRAKGLSKQQSVDRLLSTARDLGASGRDSTYGAGLMDLAAATSGLGGNPPPATTPSVPTAPVSPPVTDATTSDTAPVAPPASVDESKSSDAATRQSAGPTTTSEPDETTTTVPEETTTVPTIADRDDEAAVGDLGVNVDDDGGSVPVPAAAAAGFAVAALWLVLGRNAARLRR